MLFAVKHLTPPAVRRGALLVAVLLCAGCSTPLLPHRQPVSDLRWPASATTGPSIAWVRTIAGPEDAGIAKGFWKRTVEFFTGADDRHIVRPYGVLYDSRERLLIADPGAGVVHCLDLGEGRQELIGAGDGPRLRSPIGMTEDDGGRLYITDSAAGTVYRYDFRSQSLTPFPAPPLRRPTGIVYHRLNRLLYVVDTVAAQVVALDLNGVEQFRFDSAEGSAERFNHPTDIAVDRKGQLYVTDPLNYRIKIFTPEGRLAGEFGAAGDAAGSINKPKGVAVDSQGHIYVCDSLLDAVQIFDDRGTLLLSFGSAGEGNGAFWMPSGLFIDEHDVIYVADTYNRRIQVFRYLPGAAAAAPEGAAKVTPAH